MKPDEPDRPAEQALPQPSFAETALRMSGKSSDEAARMGSVDRADEQVDQLFAKRFQTSQSPIHKAVWDGHTPIDLFQTCLIPPTQPAIEQKLSRCLQLVSHHRQQKTLHDPHGKISEGVLRDLGKEGYWGLLIDPAFGGSGLSFHRFACFLTEMSRIDAMVAGLASVHGCIGAVDPLRAFGTVEQKQRWLPVLASGERLSAFALTEPAAGSDLTALRTRATRENDHLIIHGEKLFITNALPGRTIGLVVLLESRPAVVIADLPDQETPEVQWVHYGLHALRSGHNVGLRFQGYRVPLQNLLTPEQGDGLTIAYHGLNLGRVALCANASGTMQVFLKNMLPWAAFRHTYGQAIQTRELVKRRMARLASLITGADALVHWCSWLLDQGYRGEMECIVAKIFGSEALKEAAVELFMKTHGGRAFLHGHLFGDNVHDFLAPCIYEGEGEMLGLALFKSLIKEHGKRYFEPLGRTMQQNNMRSFNPLNPVHLWQLRKELCAYLFWRTGKALAPSDRQRVPQMEASMQKMVDFALTQFQKLATAMSAAMTKHQLKLADRQCLMAELSQRVQDTVVMLVTCLYAHQKNDPFTTAAAEFLCRELQRKLTGQRPCDRDYKMASALADRILAGEMTSLANIPEDPIMMHYAHPRPNPSS